MEITETHLNAIQEVAAALRMTVNEFLTEEVRGITPEQVTGPGFLYQAKS